MRKKLFAVIMSAMMMITFMPSMAFALDSTNVVLTNVRVNESTYATVTVDVYTADAGVGATPIMKDKVLTLKRAFTAGNSTGAGAILCTLSADALGGAYNITKVGTDNTSPFAVAGYYDLTNATIVNANVDGSATKPWAYADDYMDAIDQTFNWKDAEFDSLTTQDSIIGKYIKFTEPAELVVAPATAKTAYVERDDLVNYFSVKATPAKYVKYENDGDRDIKLTFKANASLPSEEGVINADKAVKSISLEIVTTDFTELEATVDGEKDEQTIDLYPTKDDALSNENDIDTYYVGADQNFTVKTKGVTVEYSENLGKTWTSKAPEMVNANEETVEPYEFLMRVSRNGVTKYAFVNVWVFRAEYEIGYSKTNFHFLPGAEVVAKDLLTYTVYDDKQGKYVPIYSADKSVADKILDKFVVLKNIPTAGTNASINNDNFDFDMDAFELAMKDDKTLYDFVQNYEFDGIGSDEAKISFGGENDITAPNKTKTYKAKNGKLAKTKTYTLKAKADYGTCSYTKMNTKGGSKIKVAKSGKVTIKKGLKKGSYKVKVKVKAPGTKTNMYLTVKVK